MTKIQIKHTVSVKICPFFFHIFFESQGDINIVSSHLIPADFFQLSLTYIISNQTLFSTCVLLIFTQLTVKNPKLSKDCLVTFLLLNEAANSKVNIPQKFLMFCPKILVKMPFLGHLFQCRVSSKCIEILHKCYKTYNSNCKSQKIFLSL